MIDWTEQTLRAAASWQAFKEGKALFECGAVAEVKVGSNGWQGLVKWGKRPFRVSVAVKSGTNIEARCSCPENQSSGAVCAHAVATGLATLSAKKAKPATAAAAPPPAVAAPVASVAWQILLPLNWREALARGKLSATLAVSSGDPISPADDRLRSRRRGFSA